MNCCYILFSLLILTLGYMYSFKVANLKKYQNSYSFQNKIKMKTCFYEDEHEKNINKILVYSDSDSDSDSFDKPLYTLIWYDCNKCRELLKNMEKLQLKHIYINGISYFAEIPSSNEVFLEPMLYKDDVLIGETLFDIYSEIYL